MMSKKSSTSSETSHKWEGPEPDFKMELPNMKAGQIPHNIIKQYADFTKMHHRSDEPLANWTRFDKWSTFDESSYADLIRLSLIDVLHQRQLQKTAIKAGVTSKGWDSISPQYYEKYYSWMFGPEYATKAPEEPIQKADVMATYPETPITVTDYGPAMTKDTMKRTRVEKPTDVDLGFPSILPLGLENNYSWIASIDRIPAHLFSRKICKRVYEAANRAVIVTNLPQIYEQRASEEAQNKRDLADGKEITYNDVVIDGTEVELRALQDKPRSMEEIQSQRNRREKFLVPAQPHDCHYPLFFWTLPYLGDLSQDEIHKLEQGKLLPQNTQQEDPNDSTRTITVGSYKEPPHPYGECQFRIGETDDGISLRVRAKLYIQYLYSNRDDSPLYLFESNLYKSKLSSQIPKLFHPPTWFVSDLVRDVLPISRRPPFQWFLVGSKRSGTRIHTDPRGTSAFNTSTEGIKRWVVFRAGVPSNIAKGNVVMTDAEFVYRQQYGSPQCSYWFEHILPRLRRFVFHREQKRRAVLMKLKKAGVYEFAPNGHAICTCTCKDGITRRQDRQDRLEKDYAPKLQDQVTFLCNCDCLCGCLLAGMTQCGVNLNEIEIKMDPCTTADDSFGTSPYDFPQTLLDLEQKLENEDYTQTDPDGLNIQQQIDLLLAKHLATRNGPIPGSGTVEWDELRDGYGYQEFLQYPFDTIMIPSNQFHAVLNITPTIAITENFANSSNLHTVYRSMREHNKAATRRWLYNLDKQSKIDISEDTWVKNSTNDGRNIETPMTPTQRANWYKRWAELLKYIHDFDQAPPLSAYRPSRYKKKLTDSDLTQTSDSDVTGSASTTEPESWLSTDQDDM